MLRAAQASVHHTGARAFARYDEASGGWVRPPGEFSVPHRQVFG
jgi:hypothetical protein